MSLKAVGTKGGGGGSGTVTSVGTGTGLTGGPITTSGNISIANSTANTLAGYNASGVFSDITLTTVGTSGNATLTGGNLNIPSYSGGGGSGQTVSSVSSNTNMVNNYIYLVNSSGGAITMTLPAPALSDLIEIKDSTGSAGTNNITIAQHASESIEGQAASYVISANWDNIRLCSDGTNWFIL